MLSCGSVEVIALRRSNAVTDMPSRFLTSMARTLDQQEWEDDVTHELYISELVAVNSLTPQLPVSILVKIQLTPLRNEIRHEQNCLVLLAVGRVHFVLQEWDMYDENAVEFYFNESYTRLEVPTHQLQWHHVGNSGDCANHAKRTPRRSSPEPAMVSPVTSMQSATTILAVVSRCDVASVLWKFMDKPEGVNSYGTRVGHPLKPCCTAMGKFFFYRLQIMTQSEVAQDVQQRWENMIERTRRHRQDWLHQQNLPHTENGKQLALG